MTILSRLLLLVWSVVILFSLVHTTQALVMGVDFGSQYFKIAVVRPGRIDIVLNEQSARKTQSIIAFRMDTLERLFGDAAALQLTRTPETSYPYLSTLLQPRNLSAVKSLYGEHLPFLSRAWTRQKDDLLAVNLTTNSEEWQQLLTRYNSSAVSSLSSNYTVVELVAMLLQRIKWMAARNLNGAAIQDVVLTIPVWSTQAERHLLMQAAHIAGLNVLELLHAPTAAAFKYGIERTFVQPQYVLFIDLGESGLQVELVEFSQPNSSGTSSKKNITIAQLKVVASAWSTAISGREFDVCLVRAVLRRIHTERGVDLLATTPSEKHSRLLAKLRRHLKKVKENLSANKEVHFTIENLLGDERDYSGVVTRDEFERECADLFEHLLPPLRHVLTSSNLTSSDIAAIELIGGSTRIPKVQSILKTFFQRDTLDHHLNADEAAAFGAAYYAASLSSSHHVEKEMRVKEIASWPIHLSLTSTDPNARTSTPLFTRTSRLGSKKTLTFTTKQPFNITLTYEQNPPPLSSPPPLLSTSLLSHYVFTNIPTPPVVDTSNIITISPPKIHIAFRLTSSGLVTLESAHVDYTTTTLSVSNSSLSKENNTLSSDNEKKLHPQHEEHSNDKKEDTSQHSSAKTSEKNEKHSDRTTSTQQETTTTHDVSKEASSSNNNTSSSSSNDHKNNTRTAETNRTSSSNTKTTSPSPKHIRRVHRIPLYGEPLSPVFSLYNTTKSRAEAKKRLEAWNTLEREREEIVKLRNQIETRLYELRDILSDPTKEWFRYSYPSERSRNIEVLNRIQEWLEESASSATLDSLQQQLQAIHNATHTIQDRISETTRRVKAWQLCRRLCNMTYSLLNNITLTHNVTEEEVADAKTKLIELETWMNNTETEQRARDKHTDSLWALLKEGHDITSEPEIYLEPVVTADEIDKRCQDVHKTIKPLLIRPRRPQQNNTTTSNATISINNNTTLSNNTTIPSTNGDSTSSPSSTSTNESQTQQQEQEKEKEKEKEKEEQEQQEKDQQRNDSQNSSENDSSSSLLKDEL